MSKRIGLICLLLVLFMSSPFIKAQQITDTLTTQELKQYKDQTRQLISYLQYSLNMLGDPETPTAEKDIIINQSYKKIFRDSVVQIEDDLDQNRDMPISKDVQAYLKDIVFFFKEARFEFEIKDIEHFVNARHQLTFKVTLNRNLQGTTIKGENINNSWERFVEINLNKQQQELKIASIYTHNINRKEELRQWWTKMPFRWRKVLGEKYALTDSLDMSDVTNFTDTVVRYYLDTLDVAPSLVYRQLNKIIGLKEIDISGRSGITTLKGLTKLNELRKLDISRTSVESLLPVRNLNNLEYLNAEGTPVKSLDPVRYATQIKDLLLNNSLMEDISAVANFKNLKRLHLNGTRVTTLEPLQEARRLSDLRFAETEVQDLSPLAADTALTYLDMSQTNVADLSALSGLKNLERLDARKTNVEDLSPLKNAQNLIALVIDDTPVQSLEPLYNLENLTRVYCDNSGVTETEAAQFMNKKPGSIVVYNSEALRKWWNSLSFPWKKVFRKKLEFEDAPTKADLHRISQIKTLEVSGNSRLRSIQPVSRLNNLNELNVSKTPVKDLSPLKDLLDLRHLKCSGTRVIDLSPLSGLNNLETLDCSNTSVKSTEPLAGLQHLETLYLENTLVKEITPLTGVNALQKINADEALVYTGEVKQFLEQKPGCLVIYRSGELLAWWDGLNAAWKKVFGRYVKMQEPPQSADLHQLTTLTEIEVVDNEAIKSLKPLTMFINLRRLYVNNSGIRSLKPVAEMETLVQLDVAENYQIKNLKPLRGLEHLKVLDFSNTAVEELQPVKAIESLEELHFAGTKISKLGPLEKMQNLRVIDFSNTNVIFLKPIKELKNLKKIKAYNTRVLGIFIKQFKKKRPSCEVIYY